MFEQVEMTPEAVAEFVFRGQDFQAGRRRFGPWTRGHLLGGFYGVHCPEIRLQPALTCDDPVYLWSLSKFCRVLAEPADVRGPDPWPPLSAS
eukprot:9365204-Alexandrium_andersonii.AAC.1